MRASNLMFLLVLPVILYLLAISRNYGAAIYEVLGIDHNAKLLLSNFIIFCFSGAMGFWGSLQILRSLSPDVVPEDKSKFRQKAFFAFVLQSAILLFLSQADWINPYIKSIAVNAYDPRSVDWLIMVDQSFTLSPEFEVELLNWTQNSLWQLSIVCALLALLSIFGSSFLNSSFGFWFAVLLSLIHI